MNAAEVEIQSIANADAFAEIEYDTRGDAQFFQSRRNTLHVTQAIGWERDDDVINDGVTVGGLDRSASKTGPSTAIS